MWIAETVASAAGHTSPIMPTISLLNLGKAFA